LELCEHDGTHNLSASTQDPRELHRARYSPLAHLTTRDQHHNHLTVWDLEIPAGTRQSHLTPTPEPSPATVPTVESSPASSYPSSSPATKRGNGSDRCRQELKEVFFGCTFVFSPNIFYHWVWLGITWAWPFLLFVVQFFPTKLNIAPTFHIVIRTEIDQTKGDLVFHCFKS
jgi:hypothetical protein